MKTVKVPTESGMHWRDSGIVLQPNSYLSIRLYEFLDLNIRISRNFEFDVFAGFLNYMSTYLEVIPCQTSKIKTKMSPWVENFKIDIFRGFYIQFLEKGP
jgi:hypothetical protein